MMQSLLSFKGLAGVLFAAVVAAAPAAKELDARACASSTNTRACWVSGFDIDTDYELSTPAGVDVSYSWEITQVNNWVGPDGVVKAYAQLVNGQFPGPTLFANWGDTISVTIKNSLPVNG
jgi:FtsP/CotA-like multicopper oxidase with cupredoxin domain